METDARLEELFQALPLDRAMGLLVGATTPHSAHGVILSEPPNDLKSDPLLPASRRTSPVPDLQPGEVVRLHGVEHSEQPNTRAVLAHHDAVSVARELVGGVSAPAPVLAGLWLYVDDLDRSHTISQDIHTATGSYWHAIMHRREGDFWNSKDWFRKVGDHPVIAQIGYDPLQFADDCEADRGQNAAALVELQRREWKALFDWCLREAELD